MKIKALYAMIISLFVLSAVIVGCGSSGGNSVTAEVSITNGETDVPYGENITIIFSGAITEPDDWSTAVVLTKISDADSLNLCSTTYDAESKTATCVHTVFEAETEYQISFSGINSSSGSTISISTIRFTTAAASDVLFSYYSKTSASDEKNNDIEFTFIFEAAIATGAADPDVTAVDEDDDPITVNDCSFNGGRTEFTCTLATEDRCTDFTNLTASISGTGYTSGSVTFNSGDWEFDADYLTGDKCLEQTESPTVGGAASTATIANGLLNISTPYGANSAWEPSGPPDLNEDYAATVKVYTFNKLSACDQSGSLPAIISMLRMHYGVGPWNEYGIANVFSSFDTGIDSLALVYSDDSGNPDIAYSSSGDFSGSIDAPFYLCIARRGHTIRPYASLDGLSFSTFTASELSWVLNEGGHTIDQMFAIDDSAWPVTSYLELQQGNTCSSTILTSSIDFVRFKMLEDGDASEADCPSIGPDSE